MTETGDPKILAYGVIAAGFENDRIADVPLFGGYLIFARNGVSAAEVRNVTDALRERCGTISPVFAIDQEGGQVARLRSGIEVMPSMMALGAADDLELTGRAGEQTAFDLRRAGCTLDLAPVLDLALEPRNVVIGTRSFGSDPQRVAALGLQFARGLERYGVHACYKHFPGHGSTAIDSHQTLPVIDDDEEMLRNRDVMPFSAVAGEARAMMGAHVVVRAFDPDTPATISAKLIENVLRHELGFTGAFLTDCLEMKAIGGRDASPQVAVSALRAGADLLLISHDLDAAVEAAGAIVHAVDSGALSLERLQQAYERVRRLRESPPPLPLEAFPPHPGAGREIARRAITLVRGFSHADPTACCTVEFFEEDAPGEYRELLRSQAPVLQEMRLAVNTSGADVDAVIDRIEQSRRRPIVLTRRAHLYPAQARAIARIVDRFPDAVVVSTLEPFDLDLFENARHVLAAYGDDEASIGGLADVLFGGVMPQGRLPIARA